MVIERVDDTAVSGVDDGVFEHSEIDLGCTFGRMSHTGTDYGYGDIAVTRSGGPTVTSDVRGEMFSESEH